VLPVAVRGPGIPPLELVQLVLLTDPPLRLAGVLMDACPLRRRAACVTSLSALARNLRGKHGLEVRFQVSCDDQEASQMKHVISHIVGCASLEKVGEVREGQEVEFFASLVVVQEVVDRIAR